jgi:hypothetical protein
MGDGDIATNTRNMRSDADRYAHEIADALRHKGKLPNTILNIENEIASHQQEAVLDPTNQNVYQQGDYAQTVVKVTLQDLQDRNLLPDLRLQAGSALIGNGRHRENDLQNTAYNLTLQNRPLEAGIVNSILEDYKPIEGTRQEPTFLGMGKKAGVDYSRLKQSDQNASDQFNSQIMLQQFGTKDKFNAIASSKGCLTQKDLDALLSSYDPYATGDKSTALQFMKDNFGKMSTVDPDSGDRQITFDSMMEYAKKKGVTGASMMQADNARIANENLWNESIEANQQHPEYRINEHQHPTQRSNDKQDQDSSQFTDGRGRVYDFQQIDAHGVPKVLRKTKPDSVWTNTGGDTWQNQNNETWHGTIQRQPNGDWVMKSLDADGMVTILHTDGTKTQDADGTRATTETDGEVIRSPIKPLQHAAIANEYVKNNTVSAIRLGLDAAHVKQQKDEKIGHYAVVKPLTQGVAALGDGDVVFTSTDNRPVQGTLREITDLAKNKYGNGNFVVVRCYDKQENGYRYEVYAGMTDISVSHGDHVSAGAYLGKPSQDGSFALFMRNMNLDGDSIEVHGTSPGVDKPITPKSHKKAK